MAPEQLRGHWHLQAVRMLPDGSIAGVQRLMTTWSLLLGIDEWSWHYRFCYASAWRTRKVTCKSCRPSATSRMGPWIACRPQVTIGVGPDARYPTPDELRALRAQAGNK